MHLYHRAVYIGRFQPFHNGHLKCVNYIMNKADELIILVGSAQASHTLMQPFTAGERIEMIRNALNESGVDCSRYYIIPVEDTFGSHSIWVSKVKSLVPTFDIVFSNSPLTKRLFIEAGFKVESLPFFNRKLYSATKVREKIIAEEDWRDLVPSSVYSFIISIGGDERLRDLSKSDVL